MTAWTYRACVIQGTQQIYVVALWYWGSELTKASQRGSAGSSAAGASSKVIIPVGVVIACLMWTVGTVLFIGLPKYYRQAPGEIPSFYKSIFRRKIILVSHACLPKFDLCANPALVVLRRGHNSKLLAQRSLRPQLALSLVKPAHYGMASRPPRRPLLRCYLGRLPLCLFNSFDPPLVGFACVLHGSWRATLGTDAVGYVQYWTIRAMGWRPGSKRDCW